MKKLALTLLIVPAFWLSATAQTLSTADEVINKYIAAIGGKKALMEVKDLSFESSLSNSGGSFTLLNKYKVPDKRLVLVKDETGKAIYQQVIDSKQVITKFGDNMIPTKPEDLQRITLGGLFLPELTLQKKNVKYTLAGREAINGKDAYKIIYTGADGTTLWTSYYDTQTGLLMRTLTPYKDGPQTMDYTDYREFNGIKVPYHYSGYGSETQVSKYEVNKGLSDTEFNVQ